MKRKGETFAEFLTAATVFGIIAASMFEFMANQTQTLANIRDRDNLIYGAQVVCNWNISRDITVSGQTVKVKNHNILHNVDHDIKAGHKYGVLNNTTPTYHYRNHDTGQDPEFTINADEQNSPITYIQETIVSFDWDKQHNILTVKNNNTSMTFTLKP